MNPNITLQLHAVNQGAHEFYLGVIDAAELFALARSDILKLTDAKKPEYKGVQRPISKERVREIQDYVATGRSIFPNTIIVSIDSRFIEKWEKSSTPGSRSSTMILQRIDKSVSVIDGQHRIAGLEAAPVEYQLAVAFFVDLVEEEKAEIFTKINSTQRPVNPSIAYQLFGYSSYRSPQRTAHRIAFALNTKEGSPFYKRLKLLGTQDDFARGTLSQATFARELLRLYTGKPRRDEYALMRNEPLQPNDGYPLRQLFIDEKDQEILRIMWTFFACIARTWPDQWAHQGPGNVLNKTVGYVAWMGVLREWLRSPIRRGEALDETLLMQRLATIRERHAGPNGGFYISAASYGEAGKLRDRLLSELSLAATSFPQNEEFDL